MAASTTGSAGSIAASTSLRPGETRRTSNGSLASPQDGDRKLSLSSAPGEAEKPPNANGSSLLEPAAATNQQGQQGQPAQTAQQRSRSSTVSKTSQHSPTRDTTAPANPPAKKPGLAARLFSHRGDSQTTSTGEKQSGEQGESKPRATPIRQNSLVAALKLHSNGHSDAKNSDASATAAEKTKENSEQSPASRRFIMSEDGTHEHNLKTDRREEKLSNLFRSFLGKKKEGHPVQEDFQLSLRSNWVDQIKSEKVANDQKGGPNCADTLVEKYGKCQEVVGRGAFGIVRISHKADSKDPKKEHLYAVKEFRRRPNESPKKYNKRLTAEFCISSALRHPNVIHTLDLMKDAKGDFCEVMEYCAGGDLYTLVLAAGKLEVIEADCYFKQLMRGVEYIHEMGVAHRDLKPENLLVTSHGALKITDFGNGECFRMAWEKEAHMVAGLCGSAPYIAPEEYIDQEFDPRPVDVWACGVIYMAMRTGRHLWRVARKDEDEFYERYLRGRKDEDGYGPIETLHRARCRNVVYSILDPNPGRRITASQVLKSEWGREIMLCRAGEEGF